MFVTKQATPTPTPNPNPNPSPNPTPNQESPVDWPGVFEPGEPLRLPEDHPEAGRLVAGLFGGEGGEEA